MIRALFALSLLLVAIPAQTQETGVMDLVHRTIEAPPHTHADAEALLLNRPMPEVSRTHYAMYEITFRMADGTVTFARFLEPTNSDANSGASFQLDFKGGTCHPRAKVLRAYPDVRQRPRFPTVWEEKTAYGEYFLYFDETPRQCLVGILVAIQAIPPGLPKPPSRTN
jgi:hypothetical protein